MRIEKFLSKFKDKKVLVAGDIILDIYAYGLVERISPEAPVPVVDLREESYRLGGAANVALNLKALGAEVALSGVIGQDFYGKKVLELLRENEIHDEGVVISTFRHTTVKTRIVSQGQQIIRIDKEKREPLIEEEKKKILSFLQEDAVDAIIIEDYNKGFFSPDIIRVIIKGKKAPVFVDPKYKYYEHFKGAHLVKPNFKEFVRVSMLNKDEMNLMQAALRFKKNFGYKNVVITRGDQGMLAVSQEGVYEIPALKREVFDVTGAGDTVISVLTLAMISGLSIEDAALLASVAAGIEVTKVGASPVFPGELKDAVKEEWKKMKERVRFFDFT